MHYGHAVVPISAEFRRRAIALSRHRLTVNSSVVARSVKLRTILSSFHQNSKDHSLFLLHLYRLLPELSQLQKLRLSLVFQLDQTTRSWSNDT